MTADTLRNSSHEAHVGGVPGLALRYGAESEECEEYGKTVARVLEKDHKEGEDGREEVAHAMTDDA